MCHPGGAIEAESGFIYSSLLGHFGANRCCGRAVGLTAEEMLHALAIV